MATASNPATAMQNALHEAIGLHQSGRLQEAEHIYRQVLNVNPDHPDALYLLGMLAQQAGQAEMAVSLIGRAIQVNPGNAHYYFDLGNLYKQQAHPATAVDYYRQAIMREPEMLLAHYNLGIALHALGRLEDAAQSYKNAILINPEYAAAHNNLGLVLQTQGEIEQAIRHYRCAISLMPGHASVHNNLAAALQSQGEFDAAIACYREALVIEPDYVDAHYNLGGALKAVDRLTEAEVSYHKAISLNPNYPELHCALGNVLQQQGHLESAINSYQAAMLQRPDYADAYSNLLFLSCYHATVDPLEYLALARGWEKACIPEADRVQARSKKFQRSPLAGRRLRVAYVSGDFREHAVSYFIEQIFARHDKHRIELFAYSTAKGRDEVAARLRVMVEHWVAVDGMSDAEFIEQIDKDDIDVLIDLSGHTEYNRLGIFARRAAPVQTHYLGYFASTGLTEMDYWIGDDIVTPVEMDEHFSEQVYRLNRVWLAYRTISHAPDSNWYPAADGTIWLGCFNSLSKLTSQTISLWAKILHGLPEGRLLLKNKELASPDNCARILDAMAGHGIAADRIELQRESNWFDYMAEYNRLDIALDPVGGHGGGTTTCDALWMCVPVIHLSGNQATSRFSASMLSAIGHPEWVADSESRYADTVIKLALDVEQRQTLRIKQRNKMASSLLCAADDLTRTLENAYVEMFEKWYLK